MMSQSNIQREALELGLSGRELKRRKGLINRKASFEAGKRKPAASRQPEASGPAAEAPALIAAE